MLDINWFAALAAAVAAFLAGSLWYSPVLFAKAWQTETGMTEADIKGAPMGRTMILAFALMLVAAIVVATFVGRAAGWDYGVSVGMRIGLFCVAAMTGVHYLFESRSLKLWLINAGYSTIVFSILGGVIGAFP
jgi:hypothetical protein